MPWKLQGQKNVVNKVRKEDDFKYRNTRWKFKGKKHPLDFSEDEKPPKKADAPPVGDDKPPVGDDEQAKKNEEENNKVEDVPEENEKPASEEKQGANPKPIPPRSTGGRRGKKPAFLDN